MNDYLKEVCPYDVGQLLTAKEVLFDYANADIPQKDFDEKQKPVEKYAKPQGEIKDHEEVTSRMPYIDEDLKPIAEFVIEYARWNLHRDEWNQPVPEVPLYRVLDALAQNGKPYCGTNEGVKEG